MFIEDIFKKKASLFHRLRLCRPKKLIKSGIGITPEKKGILVDVFECEVCHRTRNELWDRERITKWKKERGL